MRVIKHPGHTYGGFGSVLLEPGYDRYVRARSDMSDLGAEYVRSPEILCNRKVDWEPK
jgi:hypothetical protein